MAIVERPVTPVSRRGLFVGHRDRLIREALQGYLFLLPGTLSLLVFNLLPVGYAFWVIRGLGLPAGALLVSKSRRSLA